MRIAIRAGGTGTRLWPWSRSGRPKQFLPMFEGKSCVQMAYERFVGAGVVRPEDVYISVGSAHEALVRAHMPQVPEQNVIVEPAKMDTAAAIGLETVVVAGADADVIVASLGSDHYVEKPDQFVAALRAAEGFLRENPGCLLAIACEPTRVETNYGHIRKGRSLGESGGMCVYEASEFLEKPEPELARQYTVSGEYLWNANFFAWRAGTLMAQFEEFEPQMHSVFMELLEERDSGGFRSAVQAKYPGLKKIAIDYAVMEPASRKGRLAVLPVAMGWSDIGNWSSLTDAFSPDAQGNLLVGPARTIETSNSTIHVANSGRKIVATIGLKDMVVVDTEDALLVCPKELCGRVKELVQSLEKDPEGRQLI